MIKKKTHGLKKAPKPAIGWLCSIQIQKEVISNQKQPSCKKRCGPQKGHGEKRCEIRCGGQEIAVMVGYWLNFNNDNSGEFCAAWSWHQIHLKCRY